LLVIRALPSQASEQGHGGVVGVLEITSDASAQAGLKVDSRLRALQETTKTRVEIVVPGQQMESAEIHLVPRGGTGSAAGRQVGA
jgi:hypothetical protein